MKKQGFHIILVSVILLLSIIDIILLQKIKSNLGQVKGIEVINFGVPMYDIEYTIERFLNRGMKYNPNLVIWFVNGWNFNEINELRIPLMKKLIQDGIPDYNGNN